MLVVVFNVEIITWLHPCLMLKTHPKTAQVFETRLNPSLQLWRLLDVH